MSGYVAGPWEVGAALFNRPAGKCAICGRATLWVDDKTVGLKVIVNVRRVLCRRCARATPEEMEAYRARKDEQLNRYRMTDDEQT